ncbi:HesB/YadR/YfhF family protein [Paenibacillus sp. MSJ-34]|uniref:HesB/YadR/YfhF family protein n=1 Tax=Paenibacillus sp. MSJ-34 TaxID=2841529 RepID=UPI001C117540|nr:Fe-S cluster assembly protein HesB [Paenibacillus sp. MSJ-34]MBU5445305.1 Fe-S cluster assembly protein HesB [Paenibacillus sp. MSJ-34]
MKLIVTPAAVSCFKKEWGFREGDSIRIFVRYSGGMSPQGPFSLGIISDTPIQAAASTVAEQITFYMEQNDIWYTEGEDLQIDCEGEDIVFRICGTQHGS